MSATNWFVITGAPSSGKTTLVNHLEKAGYRVVPEVARNLMESSMNEGLTLEEIREDEDAFESQILWAKVSIEKKLPKNEVIFFDRAIPDSIAYFTMAGLDSEEAVAQSPRDHYKMVFLLDRLPFEQDPIRIEESGTAERLDSLLEHSYSLLGYHISRIPVMPAEKRLAMVLTTAKRVLQEPTGSARSLLP